MTRALTTSILTAAAPVVWIGAVFGWAATRSIKQRRASPTTDSDYQYQQIIQDRSRSLAWLVATAVVISLILSPVAGIAIATMVLGTQRAKRRRLAAATSRQVLQEVGPLLDLVAISLASGTNLDQALRTASRRGGRLGDVLAHSLSDRNASIPTVLAALDQAINRPGLRLGTTVTAAWSNGDPLVTVISRLADDARLMRRRAAEIHARRAPVRALGPLVLTTLPAFVLLTVLPLLASGLRGLRLNPIQ
jgi:Flp pilus assembly protein TadB